MDWDDLRYVRALSTMGTLAGAAERLGVHHSTVFRRLGRIEAGLGTQLFDRQREGFSLTPAGDEAMTAAERIGAEIDELERRLAGRDTRPTGTVRITTTDTLLDDVLGSMLTGFRQQYPDIRLEVIVGNPFLSLSRRDADVALRPTNAPPETLVGRRLADVATAIYGGVNYLATSPVSGTLGEHAWIAPDDSLAHLESARWLRREFPRVEPVLRCNTLVGVLAAARSDAGLAALPCFMSDQAPELLRVCDPLPELTVGLWLLTHRDLRRVARVRALLDYLHEGLAQQWDRFAG